MSDNFPIIAFVVMVAAISLSMLIPLIYVLCFERARVKASLPRYDERQHTVRRRAALHAFAAVLVYLVVWAFLDLFGSLSWTKEVFAFAMVAVILAYGVWMGECILRDVTVGWNVKGEDSPHNWPFVLLATIGLIIVRVEHIGVRIVAMAMVVVGLILQILNLYAILRDEKRKKLAETEEACEEVEEM